MRGERCAEGERQGAVSGAEAWGGQVAGRIPGGGVGSERARRRQLKPPAAWGPRGS